MNGERRPSADPIVRAALPAAGLALAMIALTLGAEWSQGPLLWFPDLLAGLAFFVLASWLWTADRPTALLALGVGVTWFLGSFLVPLAHYWHRGPLIHLVLLIPLAHARSWPRRIVLGAAYVVSILPVFWSADVVAVVAGIAVAVVAWMPRRFWLRGGAPIAVPAYGGRALWFARWSALTLASTIVAAAALKLLLGADSGLPALLQYEAALVAIAVLMALGRREVRETELTDLVVELEEGASDSLTAALARALGDPSVRVGYWNAAAGEYRDARGRTLPLPSDPGTGMTATEIARDGARFALLIHEISLEGDPRLLAAISSATLLTATNSDLRATARARVADVEASRRRLVIAADEELAVLARRLDTDIAAPIGALADRIDDRLPTSSTVAAPTFAGVRAQLRDVLDTVDATVLGLPPRELERGLDSALGALGERCPIPLTVEGTGERFPPTVEAALYLTAAEAVTNAVKHAHADAIRVDVRTTGATAVLTVSDDGRGGASPDAGTGIAGIADRIGALGGTLEVDSPLCGGTRVTARLPVGAG